PVLEMVDRVAGLLKEAGVRVKVDATESRSAGWKFNEWELKGVPLRVEIGPRDVQNNSVVLARRDVPGKEGKQFVGVDELARRVADLLAEIQRALFDRALEFRKANTVHVSSYDQLRQAVEDRKFVDAFWCGNPECEEKIKDDTRATNRCIPLDQPGDSGPCVVCGTTSSEHSIFARAY
ncbi:MAG TPA: His/Gly/Thr/Pro-type tRNA ligase C-terminal domain-containing protein, partial [Chloroflexia bacterium]|nr:His/Gly/Thr/Pro-type tRNA ligase C-terminal domain-containing protein [Chloroflexia bacterium]